MRSKNSTSFFLSSSEDIDLCLDFPNAELASQVSKAIGDNTICLTPVKDYSTIPRNCSLLEAPVLCKYHLRLNVEDSTEKGFYISQLSRNRITAVCDCLNYLRYIHQGLVKSHVNDVYWELMHHRRKMSLARMGFMPE